MDKHGIRSFTWREVNNVTGEKDADRVDKPRKRSFLEGGVLQKDCTMTKFRIEHDTFGDIEVPADHLWGAQTQRSLHHFHISTERMPEELLFALALTKRAAAEVNRELGL